jgi:hypothetical protein
MEACIGPCRQFDSTFNLSEAEDNPKMLGYKAAPGPTRVGLEYSVCPNLMLSEEGDILTKGRSARTDAGTVNITAATKQIVIILFIS